MQEVVEVLGKVICDDIVKEVKASPYCAIFADETTNIAVLEQLIVYSRSGFIHFFRPKVQGLFKDFPGHYFEISRTFLYTNLPTAKQNFCVESYVLGINTCTCRNARK